jgi:hypothetical protein
MRWILQAVTLSIGVALAAPERELPSWEGHEPDAAEWVAGSELLAADPAPDGSVMEFAEAEAGGTPAVESGLSEIPETYWPAYFAERPKEFLIDPQNLLGPVARRERLEFLKYHAGDSSIDLFVYVFGGDQEIPGEVREEELVERLFSKDRPAAVVFYFLGAPDRSVLYLSPSLADVVAMAEQRRALDSSMMQALAKVDAAGQFEAFLVQMSIRIYWMERMMGGAGEHAEAMALPDKAPMAAGRDRKSKLMKLIQPYLDQARPYAMQAGTGLAGLLLLLVLRSWMKWSARYRFPDFDVEPRLGGAHAAGVGAVISFTSAAVPPASQRDQTPEYLRRA